MNNIQTLPNVQKRVWVVDDDSAALMSAEEVLAAQGFQVETFSEPVRAIQAVALGHPDIIVLDVIMPGLDGFEFCRQLRANPVGKDVPVLMATSLNDLNSINQAYEAGATDFTTKPLNWVIETHRLRYMLRSAETAKLLQTRERETRMAKEDWERTFDSISDVATLLSPDLKVLPANSAMSAALQKTLESGVGVDYEMRTATGAGAPEIKPMPAQTPLEIQRVVWLVDDDETALILGEEVLREHGFLIVTFSDPGRAIQAVAEGRPDIIVLDVMMPGMDGFEFCRQLRANPVGKDVPVLMATSLDDLNSINQAYEAGATDFTTKPLNWAIETHRLRYMLRSAETAQMLQIKERETRMAKEDWERTFNSIPDVVTLLSPDLKVLRANSATALAIQKPLESLIGVHCYQLFQNSQEPCRDCPIMKVIETGAPASAEKRYHNPAADCLLTGTAVTDGNGRLLHVVHIVRDQTKQKNAAVQLERLNLQLIEASRQAGMAEVATGVLHNVGNVLNSVNVSANLLRDHLGRSHLHTLLKAIELLREHSADPATFLTQDPRGKLLPDFLIKLGDHLRTEQLGYQKELEGLGKNIEHIKQIVSMQQDYASFGGVTEIVDARELLDDALRLNEVSLFRQGITLVREYADSVPVAVDKHKVLQILVNLLRNAQQALTASDKNEKVLTVGIGEAEDGRVRIQVRDNGIGVLPEDLTRIFQHGFTTKKDGHGFGLHYGANAAKEMGGTLVVRSEGRGQGATFILELPAPSRETGCQAPRQLQSAQRPGPSGT